TGCLSSGGLPMTSSRVLSVSMVQMTRRRTWAAPEFAIAHRRVIDPLAGSAPGSAVLRPIDGFVVADVRGRLVDVGQCDFTRGVGHVGAGGLDDHPRGRRGLRCR